MGTGFIPDEQFKPDQSTPSVARNPSFIPDEQFTPDSEKYGSATQQALAGLEGTLRGATLGASDVAETKLGFSTPEAMRARQTENPWTAGIGNVAGGAGLLALTGGAAAPIEAGLGSGLAARALGYGAEGAIFGAGNAVSDAALGDPDMNAQKILAHIGLGAAFGAGLGALSKGIEALPAMRRASKAAEEISPGVPPSPPGAPPPVVDIPIKGVQPTSFEDMAKKVEQATKYGGQTTELPAKGVLEDAASRVDMMNPVHPLQLESLGNQEARNLYNVARELPGKEGEAIRGYEAIQKNELVSKTENAIDSISPEIKPTSDAVEGGNRAIKAFTDQYQAEKESLKPAFEALKNTESGLNVDHLPGVIQKFTDAVPGVARMFDTESGTIDKVLPYKSAWGIDKATYNAVKEAVESLKENPESFEDLANIRRGLDQHVDVLAQGQAPAQIRALKASMMDYIQSTLDAQSHNFEVRNIFKDWAINEQERGVIEKAFGASVGSPEFGAISKIKPEVIGDRIFSNTANVKAAKSILPGKDFNQILANWLSEAKAAATDNGALSSNKFNTFLRKNQDALNEAFIDNPQGLQKLRDLITMMRILPDAASINPSGTAKTLVSHLKGHDTILGVFKGIGGFAKEKFQEGQVRSEVAAALAGKSDQSAKLNSIDGIASKISKKITSAAKSVFESPSARGGAISGVASMSDKQFIDHTKRVKELSRDPHAMLNHLSDNTEALYAAAPNVTQGIHNSMIAGVQFLNSKMPIPTDEMALSPEWQPSKSQMFKYQIYYRAVNDPLSVLEDVKNDAVTSESIEALQAVSPKLLQEMRQEVLGHMTPDEAKKLPYASKLSIAKFLGQPLDQNMLPASIMASQVSLNGPNLSSEQAPGMGKTTQGGLKQLKVASRGQTRTQAGETEGA